MKARCFNPNNVSFHNYGGRSIGVCFRWVFSFEEFDKDMGPMPSDDHSLDRIDSNDHYYKANCRWVEKKQQQFNKRTNQFHTYNGITKTIAEWAVEFNIPYNRLHHRLMRNIPFEEAIDAKSWKSRKYPFRGGFATLTELSQVAGLSTQIIYTRLNQGGNWTAEEAATTPVGSRRQTTT